MNGRYPTEIELTNIEKGSIYKNDSTVNVSQYDDILNSTINENGNKIIFKSNPY